MDEQKSKTLRNLSVIQIVILILGFIAFSYAIGSSVGRVNAVEYHKLEGDSAQYYQDGKGDWWIKTDKVDEKIISERRIAQLNEQFGETKQGAQNTAALAVPAYGVASKKLGIQKANIMGFDLDYGLTYKTTSLDGTRFYSFSNPVTVGKNELIGITKTSQGKYLGLVKGSEKPVEFTQDQLAGKVLDKETGKVLTKNLVEPSGIKKWFQIRGHFLGNIIKNAGVAGMLVAGIQLIGPMLGLDQDAVSAASKAAFVGYMVGSSVGDAFGFLLKGSWGDKVTGFLKGKVFEVSGQVLLGAGVALAIFLSSYKDKKEVTVQYSCEVWNPPTGGNNCEKCNEGTLPCTEYQCRSLGQACQLLNPGTSEEKCAWVNPNDVNPPVITPWEDALLNDNYSYAPDNNVSYPKDKGVYIVYSETDSGCIKAFTPFRFGIYLDEPGRCMIDTTRKDTFDEMNLPFGGSTTLKYNHSQTITLPSLDSLASQNISLENGKDFELYVRCQDANGNPPGDSHSSSFVFKYCVDDGPDTTAPLIMGTSPQSGEPVAYNQSELTISVDVNEPADCRWNHDFDTNFDHMAGELNCVKKVLGFNAQMLYTCTGTLSGIRDREENKYYIRCKDKPNAIKDRNENDEGYELVIYGTQPLYINHAKPNGTIKGSAESIEVPFEIETRAGYNHGESICQYSESCYDEEGSETLMVDFIGETPGEYTYEHKKSIYPGEGTYNCYIECSDRGGNVDREYLKYTLVRDETPPTVVRAFKEDGRLKIITDEEATCVYGLNDCEYPFDESVQMTSFNNIEHFANWDEDKTYYIKCRDEFTNEPDPDTCSFVAGLSKDYSG